MQIKIFTIPIAGDDAILEEMNLFLRAHKIVDVRKILPNNISSIALQKRALDDFLKKNE